jgi:activator of HSP90 ATPase
MPRTLTYALVFKNTTPKKLYDLYMNSKQHTAVTGAPANIRPKEGSKFSAFGDYVSGKNLHLVKNRLIVQTWRASTWSASSVDSTFIINLEPKGKDVILHAIHANVPNNDAKGIQKGWHDYYWKPWKQFLAGKPKGKSAQM